MMPMKKKSPGKALSYQDLSDASPQPRVASGTLPPRAAHAPEFVPGDHKMTPEASPYGEKTAQRKREGTKKSKEPTKPEKEAEERAQKKKAMEEEWWSEDETFAPNLK